MNDEVTTEDLVREVVLTKIASVEARHADTLARRAVESTRSTLVAREADETKAWRSLVDHIAVLAGDDKSMPAQS